MRHGARFDVRTGEAVGEAKMGFVKMKVKDEPSYSVKVEGTDILVGVGWERKGTERGRDAGPCFSAETNRSKVFRSTFYPEGAGGHTLSPGNHKWAEVFTSDIILNKFRLDNYRKWLLMTLPVQVQQIRHNISLTLRVRIYNQANILLLRRVSDNQAY